MWLVAAVVLLAALTAGHRSRHAADGGGGGAQDAAATLDVSGGPSDAWPETWPAKRKGQGHRDKKKSALTALNKSDVYGQWLPQPDRHHASKSPIRAQLTPILGSRRRGRQLGL